MNLVFKVKNLPEKKILFIAKKIFKHFKLLEPAYKKAEVTIVFVGSVSMKKLNFFYRKKNKDTDVLSFPLNFSLKEKKYLGDIVISKEKMIKQAKEDSLEDEFIRLFVHGLYHLIGFDHQTEQEYSIMKNKETTLIQKVK